MCRASIQDRAQYEGFCCGTARTKKPRERVLNSNNKFLLRKSFDV